MWHQETLWLAIPRAEFKGMRGKYGKEPLARRCLGKGRRYLAFGVRFSATYRSWLCPDLHEKKHFLRQSRTVGARASRMSNTVVILACNEARHIARAIDSARLICDRIVVVDSGSTDDTRDIVRNLGATLLINPWKNYASQFNWALDQLPPDTEWVLRLDADEVVTPELALEIAMHLPRQGLHIEGVYVSRRMTFLGRTIRHGGVFPIRVMRLFRHGKGRCENRWMDEHIKVCGDVADFRGEILDDNLNSLTWWTAKHNAYASREVVDILNLEYKFSPHETIASLTDGSQAGFKRWLKERVYVILPGGLRAAAYFLYRYIIRFGYLDGKEGLIFHFLQGFWYRFLVDAKLHEVRICMRNNSIGVIDAIDYVLGIQVDQAAITGRQPIKKSI
jgi:glycosyltransferase involved in cell wall biosynthesis